LMCSSPTVAICASDVALSQLRDNLRPGEPVAHHFADVGEFFSPYVVELQNNRIRSSAVYADLSNQIVAQPLTIFKAVTLLINIASHVMPRSVLRVVVP
jgi:hypothetical protein